MLQILYSSGGLDLDIFSEKNATGATAVYKLYKKTDVFFSGRRPLNLSVMVAGFDKMQLRP